jgi:hypothetical protein
MLNQVIPDTIDFTDSVYECQISYEIQKPYVTRGRLSKRCLGPARVDIFDRKSLVLGAVRCGPG